MDVDEAPIAISADDSSPESEDSAEPLEVRITLISLCHMLINMYICYSQISRAIGMSGVHSPTPSAHAIGMSGLRPHSPTPSIHTAGTSAARPPSPRTGIVILERYLSRTGMVLPSIEVTREMQERLDAEVPVELQHRLDDAILLIDAVVEDMTRVRTQLNAINDLLHTTIMDLGCVRSRIAKKPL